MCVRICGIYCCYDAIILEFYFHLSGNFHNYYNLRIRFMSVFISFLFISSLFTLFCLGEHWRTRTQAQASNWYGDDGIATKSRVSRKLCIRFSSLVVPRAIFSVPLSHRTYIILCNLRIFICSHSFWLACWMAAIPFPSGRGCSCHFTNMNHDDDCCIVGGERGVEKNGNMRNAYYYYYSNQHAAPLRRKRQGGRSSSRIRARTR